jgi:hypothetical protein
VAGIADISMAVASRVIADINGNHPEITLTSWNLRTVGSVVSRQVAKALQELIWDEPVREAVVASAKRQGIIVSELVE